MHKSQPTKSERFQKVSSPFPLQLFSMPLAQAVASCRTFILQSIRMMRRIQALSLFSFFFIMFSSGAQDNVLTCSSARGIVSAVIVLQKPVRTATREVSAGASLPNKKEFFHIQAFLHLRPANSSSFQQEFSHQQSDARKTSIDRNWLLLAHCCIQTLFQESKS